MPLPDIVHRALLPEMLHVPLRMMQHYLQADAYTYAHFAGFPDLKNPKKANNAITNINPVLSKEFNTQMGKFIFNTPISDAAMRNKLRLLTSNPDDPRYGEFYKLFSKYNYHHILIAPVKSAVGTSLLVFMSANPMAWDANINKKLRVFNRAMHGHTHANLATYFDPYLFPIKKEHLKWLQVKADLELTTKEVAEHFDVPYDTVKSAFKRLLKRTNYSTETKLVKNLTKIGYLK